jgi:hypothetical protein
VIDHIPFRNYTYVLDIIPTVGRPIFVLNLELTIPIAILLELPYPTMGCIPTVFFYESDFDPSTTTG